eukprot:CAMPEP_0170483508 /NCGR_PEP_ID=MMETSP0208-20121228/3175_1 /TAXON_ID=197538 /ORGANISM="Strombidium inclinatum, Strain S3" /LENGTH=69 /DNA_ID=CAMNT_0010756571 /DNA_START=254 /DNA_END=463 /DNA_ORIENTATION=-
MAIGNNNLGLNEGLQRIQLYGMRIEDGNQQLQSNGLQIRVKEGPQNYAATAIIGAVVDGKFFDRNAIIV